MQEPAGPQLTKTPIDAILRLEQLDDLLYRSIPQPGAGRRMFGGQVAGQAVMAAGLTVPADRVIHSAHAHFLLPGDATIPVLFHVDAVRDGGSFTTRRVEAVQHGQVILHLTASFQKEEAGFEHQVGTPNVPGPDDLPTPEVQFRDDPESLRWHATLTGKSPIEFRFPDTPTRVLAARGIAGPPRQSAWTRSTAPLPDDRLHQAAALTYLSDILLLSTALAPHRVVIQDPDLQFATLDHTIWFHSPCRADEWLLHDQESHWAGAGRAVCRGSFFDQSGRLVATTMQEGLLRMRSPQQ
ncbi:acyl-CoA thioesterase II [Aeromicrobium sp. S22]|uniref:acyl-CoA thioesterase n=1 Tax=Aeromicrobium sp. S22 TaxID=2662029 RepID=UPI00129EEBB1|nr:acyl-CoA thioesterase II [Aeromicrobium sp. S22]MRK01632.1 acyl-CoA thioesterase II [Aeromicrobium sp. S22]